MLNKQQFCQVLNNVNCRFLPPLPYIMSQPRLRRTGGITLSVLQLYIGEKTFNICTPVLYFCSKKKENSNVGKIGCTYTSRFANTNKILTDSRKHIQFQFQFKNIYLYSDHQTHEAFIIDESGEST